MAIQIDNFTILLLLILAALAVYHRFLSIPTALVHPLLLGKQSDVSAVRRKGESGVYRSFATGQGSPLTVRPANSLKTVSDVVPVSSNTPPVQRCILDASLTDEALSEILRLLPLGLTSLFPLLSNASASPTLTPILTLLPPTPSASLPLLLLSLAASPTRPLIILPQPTLLSTALTATSHPRPGIVVVHASLLDDVLEQVWEDCGDRCGVLIVGDMGREKSEVVGNARERGMAVRWWEEIWEVAEKVTQEKVEYPNAHFGDVHSYFYSIPDYNAAPVIVKATHLNITAGIAGLLSLFPADKRPSAALRDVVASAIPLDTPFGMTIALASVWSGAGFRFIGRPEASWSVEEEDQAAQLEALADGPKPAILFITSKHHEAMLGRLHASFHAHPLGMLAARQRLPSLNAGHVSRAGYWDQWVWSGVRERVLGGVVGEKLRGVIVVGDAPPASNLGISHLLLSLPLTRLHPSPLSAGPIFVSHFNDIQCPPPPADVSISASLGERSHSGPPASNIEVLLKGPGVEVGHSIPLRGTIWVRGPSVLERVDGRGEVIDGWTNTEEEAKALTSGTFVVGAER